MRTNNYIVIYSGVNRSTRAQVFELFEYISQPKHNYELHVLQIENN